MEKWGQANTYSGYRHGFGRDLHRENLTQPEKSGRDVEDGQQGPKQQLRRGVTVLKALAVRTMFVIHSVLVVWRVVDVKDNDLKYWCMLGLLVVLVIEGGVTIYAQNGEENKWFSMCVLLFLCVAVPGIWILELDRLDRYNAALSGNTTWESEAESLSKISGVNIPIRFDADLWVEALEQMLLFVLIVGRWILPKGSMTRNQLSLLLLVYVGMASDIMDVFVLYEEPAVVGDDLLGYIILGVWSFSLLQFCMVLTVTRSRRSSVSYTHLLFLDDPSTKNSGCMCCETEIWSILTTIFMQDGPFLTVRLLVTIKYKILNYSLLFFTCKNVLVIVLQLYRLFIVLCNAEDDKEDTQLRLYTYTGKEQARKTPKNKPVHQQTHHVNMQELGPPVSYMNPGSGQLTNHHNVYLPR